MRTTRRMHRVIASVPLTDQANRLLTLRKIRTAMEVSIEAEWPVLTATQPLVPLSKTCDHWYMHEVWSGASHSSLAFAFVCAFICKNKLRLLTTVRMS